MTDTTNIAESLPTTGRAVRFDHYGDIDVLRIEEVPISPPGDDEVLVRVKAAGINPGEASIREGYLEEMFPTDFPSGEGTDFAGVVVAAGASATAYPAGSEVLGWSWTRSSHADYVTVPVGQVVGKPGPVSWEVAGSLSVAATTAYAAVEAVRATASDTVVVSAAAGGVGSIATQLLVARGVDVIGIASEANHAWLTSVGARPVAYGDDLVERIRALAPDGVDALVDFYGEEYVRLGIALGVPAERIDTAIAFEAAAEVGAQTKGSADATTPEILRELAKMVTEKKVEVPIDKTFPLDRVRDAFAYLEQHHAHGKVVLVP